MIVLACVIQGSQAEVRKMPSSTGTRAPITATKAIANAVSVAIGPPHLCDHGPAGMTSKYRSAGATMPPMAAEMGSAAERFTFSPTTRKNTVSRPSSTQ